MQHRTARTYWAFPTVREFPESSQPPFSPVQSLIQLLSPVAAHSGRSPRLTTSFARARMSASEFAPTRQRSADKHAEHTPNVTETKHGTGLIQGTTTAVRATGELRGYL